jgi:hypothetical protein
VANLFFLISKNVEKKSLKRSQNFYVLLKKILEKIKLNFQVCKKFTTMKTPVIRFIG